METYTPPHVTLNQALSWFDEDELRQFKREMTDNMVKELKAIKKPTLTPQEAAKDSYVLDPETNKIVHALLWVRRGVYELQVNKIMDHYKRLGKRINGRLYQFDFPEGNSNGVTDAQIDQARDYPIQDLFTELVNTPIRGGMAKCPFHPDKTASLSLRRHNRFHCFGCQEKGDTIAFYMKIQNVPFITAVDKLSTGAV